MASGLVAKFGRFTGAGTIGFVVDATIFFGLVTWLHWHYAAGRVLASLVALAVTWLMNRTITFQPRPGESLPVEFLRYLGASALGAGANLLTVMLVAPYDADFRHIPAYVIGAGVGLVVNFMLYDKFVFQKT